MIPRIYLPAGQWGGMESRIEPDWWSRFTFASENAVQKNISKLVCRYASIKEG